MIPPFENVIAAFPPSVKVGNITLKPLTLEGAIRLGKEGIDVGREVPAEKLLKAAFVLSGETDERKFLRRLRTTFHGLKKAVETALNLACETSVPDLPDKRAKVRMTPSGLGWPIEYAEWLCAEYGWSLAAALSTPVVTVHALSAACRKRHGKKFGGPDYVERRWMEEHRD